MFIEHVSFDNDIMPGVKGIRSELQSWQWIYGKTPDFKIHHTDPNLPHQRLTIEVSKGLIEDVQLHSEDSCLHLTEHYKRLPLCPVTLYYYEQLPNSVYRTDLMKSLIEKMRLLKYRL